MNGTSFEKVLEDELKEIVEKNRGRRDSGQSTTIPPARNTHERALLCDLIGLAFSGGGIRSATFNLGVLQALAELKLLRKIDYLSTVSGGGYIGSWFQAWLRRTSLTDVEDFLRNDRYEKRDGKPQPEEWAKNPIQFLRQYSNYLTPKLGFFSADTWTMVSIYLRNLILNQSVLVSLIAAVLLLPRILVFVTMGMESPDPIPGISFALAAAVVSAALVLYAVYQIGTNLQSFPAVKGAADQSAVLKQIVLPLVIAAWLGSSSLWSYAEGLGGTGFVATARAWLIPAVVVAGMLAFQGWTSNVWQAVLLKEYSSKRVLGLVLLSSVLPGVAAGLIFALLIKLFSMLDVADYGYWHAITWGTPLMLIAFSVIAILHIGLLGVRLPDEKREWWSRLGACVALSGILWSLLFAIALYSPLLVAWSITVAAGLGVGWIGSTIWGVVAGKSAKTGPENGNALLTIVAKVAPYIFIFGLLVIISVVAHFLMAYLAGAPEIEAVLSSFLAGEYSGFVHWRTADLPFFWVLGSFLVLTGIGVLLAWRVDINEFSMHQFYRNRLVRCYLGASRKRHPQPFTAFDPEDDFPISRLATNPPGSAGPYPIINATLNLVGGEQLAWQQRMAASFVFTPRYSGYELSGELNKEIKAYRSTDEYTAPEGVSLGTAFAISGAAASPNMGYHSSIPVAFLMTMFNVRMGWWLGNPADDKFYKRKGPQVAIGCLLQELLGMTDEKFEYVYLSDGGHFENLGVYELVRRRCRFIIACDGSQDEKLRFDDLGNLIRKCRTDFGIDIEIGLDSIRLAKDAGYSEWHCAVGTIRYDLAHPGMPVGTLVYLKSSVTGDEDADVLNYRSSKPEFPHESTADQWFDESQFESYRTLGYHVAMKTFKTTANDATIRKEPADFFAALREAWYPNSPTVRDSFSKHGMAIDEMFNRLRTDENLHFLDQQFYLHWRELAKHTSSPKTGPVSWIPSDPKQMRSGFYFCNSLIQLMENVFIDLDLAQNFDHPDNRGWMNLFKHWSWSGMFRVTWAVTASTFGARFQTFCRQQLSLNYEDRIHVAPGKSTDDALNFHEQTMIKAFEGKTKLTPKVYLLQMKVTDVTGLDKREVHLTFGFALVEGENIVAFRIQDHLRKMGLGRRGVIQLVKTTRKTEFAPGPLSIFKGEISPDTEDYNALAEWRLMASDASTEKFKQMLEFAKSGN